MNSREIESQFNETFSHWNIFLPPDAIASRKRGKVVKAGWSIWYLFGSDEKGEYLDYYASHRMTTDRHVRIYANGNEKDLPTIESMRMVSRNPEEDARLEAEYFARNQGVARMLEAKGFGMQGDEPDLTQVNRYLYTEKMEE